MAQESKNNSDKDAQAYSVSSKDNRGALRQANKVKKQDDWINVRIPKVRPPKLPSSYMHGRRLRAMALAALLIVSVCAGFAGGYWGASHRENSLGIGGSLSSQKKIVTSEGELISNIAKTVGPSVVSVDVVGQTQNTDPYSLFFGGNSGQSASAGTGIIISSDGLIITNRHVVPAGTTSVSVTLSDGTKIKDVQVVGRTSNSDSLDIAFLKITDAKGHKLVPAVVGDSSKLTVGDAVVAIGNALGQFQNTVTSGIISGFGRSVQAGDSSGTQSTENLDDLFQTDAAINEGNSGGPLVNLNGQVIGINTAIASNSQNIGFAIPINDVAGLIKQVKATGKLQRPYLGIRYVPLSPDIANQYNLSVNNGAFIAPGVDPTTSPAIIAGGPAEQAGLVEGDVITQINGKNIDQTHSLTSIIDQYSIGDKLKLTVFRDGKTIHLNATLGTAPGL